MPHDDDYWMSRAIALAERGRGCVEPNPLVGAVIVRDGVCVGEGWHERFGQAHAEVNALAKAGEAARGATLYVTLEPCCHHGKTPPCTDAVLRAGIGRVVAALRDPFPKVAGQGAVLLQAAGVGVEFGPGEADARRQNAPYLKRLATGLPWVHAKWAMSLDGKIATRTGDSRWISGESSRQRVHSLRGRMDGIMVGVGTALADDPLLTARPPGPRTPTRVVVDSRARLPLTSQLVQTAKQIPTLIATCSTNEAVLDPLRSAGCEVLGIPPDQSGTGRVDALALLVEFGSRGWTNLLVEGGGLLLGSLFDVGAVDEAHVFVGPLLIGQGDAKSPIAGQGWDRIADCPRLRLESVERCDDDVYLRYGQAVEPIGPVG